MTQLDTIPGQLSFDDPILAALDAPPAPRPQSRPEPRAPAPELNSATDPAPVVSPRDGEPGFGAEAPGLEPEPEPEPAAAPAAVAPTVSGESGLATDVPALEVRVIRSSRRKKTAQARLFGSTVEVRIPARCSVEEERQLVDHFTDKFERARSAEVIDLERRARKLADQFGLPQPASVRWVGNQQMRWGSCTPGDGTIRLSDRLAQYPTWVLDYVIVHELAHLRVAAHNAEFWRLVHAYPLTERARGFLIAKGHEGD